MLVLAIPQISTCVRFVFNLRLHIVSGVIYEYFLKNWVFEGTY